MPEIGQVLIGACLLGALAAPSHAQCAGPRVLENRLELRVLDMTSFIAPKTIQKATVRDAARKFSTLTCASAKRLAYLSMTGENASTLGLVRQNRPDLITIAGGTGDASEDTLGRSANKMAQTVHSILHEAAHTGDYLLSAYDLVDERDLGEIVGDAIFDATDWTNADASLAQEINKRNVLEFGFRQAWKDLHERAVALDLAKPYHGAGDPAMSDDAILEMGVATAYGGDDAPDDIAEMAAAILSAEAYRRNGVTYPAQDLVCQKMQAEDGPGIPSKLATIYAKLGFLHSVGMISDSDYETCVGALRVRAPGNGFFSLKNGQQINSYTSEVKGTIGTREADGMWVFQIQAKGQIGMEGSSKSARIELTIPLVPADQPRPTFPRGVYKMGSALRTKLATAHIYYTDGGEEKLGISISNGDVLIARASTDLVEGSIFVKSLINWTELFPLPIPPKDETIFTFRKEN